jgi:hypothetical protein
VDGSSTILSFVAIPSPAKAIATLSGVLGDADESIAEKVTISLYRHGAENKVLQRTTLKESNRAARFFSFSGIPDGKYIVKASLQSKELDSKEVNIGTGQGGLVHLSASGIGVSSAQDSGGVGGDTDSMDDINAAGPFFSILFASLIFAGVMFPSTAGTFLLPGLALIAQLSGSARGSMARSSVALLKKAADRAASRMEPAAGADDGYDMTGGLTTSKKKHKSKGK